MSRVRKTIRENEESAVRVLKLATQAAEIAPVPFVKGILGTVVLIVETAQKVRANRDDCRALAQRAVDLALGIEQQLLEHESRLQSVYMQRNLEGLVLTLEGINEFMNRQAARSWLNGLRNIDEVSSQIQLHATKLDDAARLFQIRSVINIESLVLNLNAELQRLRIEQHTSAHRGEEGIKLLWDDDINLKSDLTPVEGPRKDYRGELNGRAVVVRYYISNEDGNFEKDLKQYMWLKKFFHPNISQLVGRSHLNSQHHFLVIRSGVISTLEYMQSAVGTARVALAARILTQIYSGVSFWEDKLTNRQWEGNESQILLDQEGQVFLGESDAILRPASEAWWSSTQMRVLMGGDISSRSRLNYASRAARRIYHAWRSFADSLDRHVTLDGLSSSAHEHLVNLWADAAISSFSWYNKTSTDVTLRPGDIAALDSSGQFCKVGNIPIDDTLRVYENETARLCGGHWQQIESSLVEATVENGRTVHTFFPKKEDRGLTVACDKFLGLHDGPTSASFLAFAQQAFTLADALGREPHEFILVISLQFSRGSHIVWTDNSCPGIIRFYGTTSDHCELTGDLGYWCTCSKAEVCEACRCEYDVTTQSAFRVYRKWPVWVDYMQLTRDECLFLRSLGWPWGATS